MKIWYAILRISPLFVLVAGLTWAAQDAVALTQAPPEFRVPIISAGVGKLFFSLVGASAVYWLRRLVDQLIPGVKG
jgi:hypothetical protein